MVTEKEFAHLANYFNRWVKDHLSQDYGRFDAFLEGFIIGKANFGVKNEDHLSDPDND